MTGKKDWRRAARVGCSWPGKLGFGACARWLLVAAGVAAIAGGTAPGAAWAQEPKPPAHITFKADVDEGTELKFGDVVPFVLEITHSPDKTVNVGRLPRYPREWGPFEVREQTRGRTTSNDDGTVTMRQEIHAAALGRGILRTPDIPITIRHPDGSVEPVLPIPVEVWVRSLFSQEGDDPADDEPADIQPQADLSTPLLEDPVARSAAVGLAAGAVLAVAVAGAYYVYRRTRGRGSLPLPVVDTRTPWDVAIEELDRIERLDLPEYGRFKEHYTLVADTMRVYIHAMYLADVSPVDAIDMTTDETAAALKMSVLDAAPIRLILDLLNECDLVKFARYTPSVSSAYEASGHARYIVEVTRPALDDGRLENAVDARREVTV